MEAARKLKVNLKLEGKPCRWCQETLQLGDDAAVCTACDAEHHTRCWDGKGGCTTPGCVNEPLKRFDAPPPNIPQPVPGLGVPAALPMAAAPPPLPPGMIRCNYCRNAIMHYEPICPFCRAITSPDGIYYGPKTTAPGAVASLVCGIIGIFFCQFILGPIAIVQASKAKREIAMNPTYGGAGIATAGMVCGIVALVVIALYVIVMASHS